MKQQFQHCFRWIALLLVSVLIGTGCTGPGVIEPASTPVSTPSPGVVVTPTSVPTSTPEAVITPTLVPSPAREPEAHEDVLYADVFKDPTSGWPNEIAFDNYYIGYHEPEWYHVEVHEQNDSEIVVLPGRTFDDFTVESEILVSGANTAPDGDFRYGLAVRRSGNRFYAFTISPRTKTWYVFKSSPTGLDVLDEGADDSIQGLTDLDTLRVDARGPALTFHINGQPVSQVSDSDYADGALGFFVETFDNPRAHIHYDSLTIRKAPEVIPTLSRPISKATTPTSTAPARTRTPVPLRRATPPGPPAVVLLAPVDGARLHGRVTFRWGWAGTPGPGETFDVRVCKSQECAPEFGKTNTAEPTWIWQPDQGVGTYRWQVVVIRWEEDRVVAEQAHSPVWRFEWTGGGEEKRPEPTPTPPPYP